MSDTSRFQDFKEGFMSVFSLYPELFVDIFKFIVTQGKDTYSQGKVLGTIAVFSSWVLTATGVAFVLVFVLGAIKSFFS